MKLSVREFWSDDGPFYYIEDQETGTLDVVDITFASRSEAQAYLDTHREEIERKGLPPLSPEEVVEYWKTVDITEKNLDARADIRWRPIQAQSEAQNKQQHR